VVLCTRAHEGGFRAHRGWRSRCIKELVRPAQAAIPHYKTYQKSRHNCKVYNMRLQCKKSVLHALYSYSYHLWLTVRSMNSCFVHNNSRKIRCSLGKGLISVLCSHRPSLPFRGLMFIDGFTGTCSRFLVANMRVVWFCALSIEKVEQP
jgi:hypothetical protein